MYLTDAVFTLDLHGEVIADDLLPRHLHWFRWRLSPWKELRFPPTLSIWICSPTRRWNHCDRRRGSTLHCWFPSFITERLQLEATTLKSIVTLRHWACSWWRTPFAFTCTFQWEFRLQTNYSTTMFSEITFIHTLSDAFMRGSIQSKWYDHNYFYVHWRKLHHETFVMIRQNEIRFYCEDTLNYSNGKTDILFMERVDYMNTSASPFTFLATNPFQCVMYPARSLPNYSITRWMDKRINLSNLFLNNIPSTF